MAAERSLTAFIMKDKIKRILSTRLLDEALIKKAAFQNIIIEAFSFIETKKLESSNISNQITGLSAQAATVVFTSIHAAEAVIESLTTIAVIPGWKIFCIGGATLTSVRNYWTHNSIFTANNAAELAEKIILNNIDKTVFFCGNQRRDELPVLLRAKNIAVNELVVYETTETPVTIKEEYNGILFFSPSAVNSFFSANKISPAAVLFAIGNTTANAIKEFTHNKIVTTEFPSKEQLVDKVIRYFKSRNDDEKA